MTKTSNDIMVENAKACLENDLEVWVGGLGLPEPIRIRDLYTAVETDVVIAMPAGGKPEDRIIFAPGALSVLKAIDTSNPLQNYLDAAKQRQLGQ